MKKVVLKLSISEEKEKKKAMTIVSGIGGVVSITVDMKDKKMTVIGNVDEVTLVSQLRNKICSADIVSVGPAKEKEDKKGGGGKKDGGGGKKSGANKKDNGAKKDGGGGKKDGDNKKGNGAKKDAGGGKKDGDGKKKEIKVVLTFNY